MYKQSNLSSFLGKTLKYLDKGSPGAQAINWGIPAGVGGLGAYEAHTQGFDPFESAMLGLAAGSFASPRGLARAVKTGLKSKDGPVGGIFSELREPLTNKALIAGVGLAPGILGSTSNILSDTEGITSEVQKGTQGFEETGQKLQENLKNVGTNVESLTEGANKLTETLQPASAAIASIPDKLDEMGASAGERIDNLMGSVSTGGKAVLASLVGAVGITGTYLLLKRFMEHREKMTRYELRKSKPPKKRPIKIDPGDYNLKDVKDEQWAEAFDDIKGDDEKDKDKEEEEKQEKKSAQELISILEKQSATPTQLILQRLMEYFNSEDNTKAVTGEPPMQDGSALLDLSNMQPNTPTQTLSSLKSNAKNPEDKKDAVLDMGINSLAEGT